MPDHLSFDEAALAEPLAVCVHAVNLGLSRSSGPISSAIVLGGGAIGLLCALVLDLNGVSDIQIAETNGLRRDMLKSVTASKPYNPIDETPTGTADLVLDCVGSGITRASASKLVKPGGTIVHVGLQDNDPGLDSRRITLQEIAFIGTYCYTAADFSVALDLLSAGKISRKGWTEIRPLSEGGQGFLDIHAGKAYPKIILEV